MLRGPKSKRRDEVSEKKMQYYETYKGLYHGTTREYATKILHEGFCPSEHGWLGPGIYFYDIRSKAFWSAERTCARLKEETGIKPEKAVLCCNIDQVNRQYVMDLRDWSAIAEFGEYVDEKLSHNTLEFSDTFGMEEEEFKRALLIATYADEKEKKLIIGTFEQREQEKAKKGLHYAREFKLIAGVETIYCARDPELINDLKLSTYCEN